MFIAKTYDNALKRSNIYEKSVEGITFPDKKGYKNAKLKENSKKCGWY